MSQVIALIKTQFVQLELKWNRFWFYSDSIEKLSVFRTFFGLTLLSFYLVRSLDLEFFLSDHGILQLEVLPEVLKMDYRFSLLNYFKSVAALWVLNGIFLLSLFTLSLNRLPRVSASVALILHLSFLHRNPAGNFGADFIAVFYLFFLALAGRGDGILGSIGLRLGQIQLCVIYAYSGMHKLKSPLWWKGEAMWHILINTQLARFDFSWVAHFPVLLVFSAFSTVLFEIYFPALISHRRTRYFTLFFGVLLHLGIGLTLNIPHFAAIMLSVYFLFLDQQHVESLANSFLDKMWLRRSGSVLKLQN